MSCRVCAGTSPGRCYCVPCSVCGKSVDTLEVYEGGSPDGCEIDDGVWVCSFACWDSAVMKPST